MATLVAILCFGLIALISVHFLGYFLSFLFCHYYSGKSVLNKNSCNNKSNIDALNRNSSSGGLLSRHFVKLMD